MLKNIYVLDKNINIFKYRFIKCFISIIHIILILINYIFLNKKIKNNNELIGLCVIGRNENLYIKEFVRHYRKLGYNHIFLYDNNDLNGEKFEDVISNEISNGFVSIINYRGKRGKNIHPQSDAYRDCYKKNNQQYIWLSFFDIDEYLHLIPENLKIYNFLNKLKFKKCQIIKINWLCYTNENSLYYRNLPLKKRIKTVLYNNTNNYHIKSTVRGNLSQNYWTKMENPHTSINDYISCNSNGNIINSSSPFNYQVDYNYSYLKHYIKKSFEEYCLKIKRGRPLPQYKYFREKYLKNLIKENKNIIYLI